MKKKIAKVIILVISFILLMQVYSMAAGKVIKSTDKEVTSGKDKEVTVSVTSTESLANYELELTDTGGLEFKSAAGPKGDVIVEINNKKISGISNGSGTKNLGSFTFEVPDNITTDTKYKIQFSITVMDTIDGKSLENETNSATVTVKPKEVTPEPPPVDNPEPQPPVDNPTTEKPTEQKPATEPEPTFQEVNEKVYATTSGVNVRESYSTSSKSIGTLKEGQEYTRTGKGSNDWSRISYNGKTAYVYSKYLTTTKPVAKEKSDNANLKSLVIENHDIIPSFSSSTTSYKMQVKNDVTELNIKAEAEDAKATVSIKGEKDLKEGENIATISVSAEDGTTKTYEVKVTKLPETTLSLQTLSIEGTDVENEFQPDIYEYEIQFRELTKLNIEAIANEETAKVEIIGNEDLEEGENIITIIVSSEDESEKVTYQIKAKKLVANTTTQKEKQSLNPSIYLYIAIGAILLVTLIIVIIYTIKNRKQEDYEEEEFEEFPGELPERQEDVNDNDRDGRGKHF